MTIPTDNSEVGLTVLAETDAEPLFALADQNRAYLRQWLWWLDGLTKVEHTHEFIKGTMTQHEKTGTFVCGVRFQGALVGVIGHNSIDRRNRISFPGYWLSQAHTGKGIMTCAVRGLILHAFEELGLNRIDIRVAVGNTRSQAIPDRLGFRREGVIRQAEWLYDRFVDHTVNGLLRNEWT